MKFELTTSNPHRPITIYLKGSGVLVLEDHCDTVELDKEEVKELRDFLNQLEL